jgi:thiosulfate reductase cytochrome b subunit
VSAYEHESRRDVTTSQLAADFLATVAVFAGLVGIVYTPGLVCTAAVVVAILAATIGGRDRWLVPFTVVVTGTCWFVGMALAVLLERPII